MYEGAGTFVCILDLIFCFAGFRCQTDAGQVFIAVRHAWHV